MSTLVLDATVAVKWAFPAGEPLVAQAVQLLNSYIEAKTKLLVPDLFWAEFGNVVWKGVRQKRWSRNSALAAVAEMAGRKFLTVSSAVLLPQALEIAINFGRSVYDSLYVALAVSANSQLITADERLANALAAYLPVKWLGAM